MNSHEVFIPSPSVSDAINITNHEVKGASYVGLVELGDATRGELARELITQTGVTACKDFVMNYPFNFARTGFAMTDQFRVPTGQMATHFIAARQDEALPAIGTLQEWGEVYDMSVIPVFTTVSYKGGGAANALAIIDALLAGQKLHEVTLPGYKPVKKGSSRTYNYDLRLSSLVKNGLVVEVEDPNEFTVNDPVYRGVKPFELLSAETQALYQVLKAVKQLNPDSKWTASRITELAERLNLITPQQESKFRHRLATAVSDKKPRDFPGAIHKRPLVPITYGIHEPMREELSDLVERVKRLDRSSKKDLKANKDYAFDAYYNPEVISRIVLRGIRYSLYANEQTKLEP
jgi:hypothetical protein